MKTHIEDCWAQADGTIRYLVVDDAGRQVTVDQDGRKFSGFVRPPHSNATDAGRLLRSAIATAKAANDDLPE